MSHPARFVLCAIALTAALPAAAHATPPKAAPSAATIGIEGLQPTGVTVKGAVNPRGEPTNVLVQYGKGARLNASTPPQAIPAGNRSVPVKIALSNLSPVTRYSFRVVAFSVDGRSNGATKTFRTPKIPPSATLAAAPAVVQVGQTVVLSGTIGGTGAPGSRVVAEQQPFPYVAPFAAFTNTLIANPAGAFTFAAQPAVSTHYRVRATVGGRPTASPIVAVGVAQIVSLRARRTRSGRVRFSGTIRPGSEAVVKLRRLTPRGRRITISRTTARASGRFRFRARRLRRTARYLVLVQPTNAAYVKMESKPRTVRRTR